ncbi:hypothetical protein CBR_g8650 [Chara braunii]|uniref:RING-type E3 ubiquitin transferase n=1 Tax=Chara braunii TaxID=69332 RepID=A0A388JS79_CHABU|nr:hypothetical protein CBR_g8650 [Chara braunii]|eukprot:GBG60630.1 hypothetical protein CBR_g8650 [Chara braunii]
MISLAKYSTVSLLLSIAVVYHAYQTREQFYPAMLYLATSKICVVVLGNMAFVLTILFWHLLKKIFLGNLREAEVERLQELLRHETMETCLAMTIFRGDFNASFVAMFTALLFIKIFHWLSQKRVEYIETTPSVSRLAHARIISFMFLLLAVDIVFLKYSIIRAIGPPSVHLLFAFEYVILASSTVATCLKYVLYTIDVVMEGQWDNKAVYVFYLELVRDLLHLFVYLLFFLIIFVKIGLPLHLIRDLYETFRNFKARVGDFIRYRRITSNMDKFPEATQEELGRGDATCIICREEMSSAKKLPCGHLFHILCLRSWLERHMTCPTCRAPVLPPENANQANEAAARHMAQPGVVEGVAPGVGVMDGQGAHVQAGNMDYMAGMMGAPGSAAAAAAAAHAQALHGHYMANARAVGSLYPAWRMAPQNWYWATPWYAPAQYVPQVMPGMIRPPFPPSTGDGSGMEQLRNDTRGITMPNPLAGGVVPGADAAWPYGLWVDQWVNSGENEAQREARMNVRMQWELQWRLMVGAFQAQAHFASMGVWPWMMPTLGLWGSGGAAAGQGSFVPAVTGVGMPSSDTTSTERGGEGDGAGQVAAESSERSSQVPVTSGTPSSQPSPSVSVTASSPSASGGEAQNNQARPGTGATEQGSPVTTSELQRQHEEQLQMWMGNLARMQSRLPFPMMGMWLQPDAMPRGSPAAPNGSAFSGSATMRTNPADNREEQQPSGSDGSALDGQRGSSDRNSTQSGKDPAATDSVSDTSRENPQAADARGAMQFTQNTGDGVVAENSAAEDNGHARLGTRVAEGHITDLNGGIVPDKEEDDATTGLRRRVRQEGISQSEKSIPDSEIVQSMNTVKE